MRVLDRELELFQLELIKMCSCVSDGLKVLKAQFKRKEKGAEETLRGLYGEVKHYAALIEAGCMRLLVLHQPVAGDLRRIRSALGVIVDISRVAEQGCHVCELELNYPDFDTPKRMCAKVEEMFAAAAESYFSGDAAKADAVIAADDMLDEAFNRVRRQLKDKLKCGEEWDELAPDCLLAVKYLERMGDHAVRIASAAKLLKDEK